MTTSLRKLEHLHICANDPVEAHVSARFDDVRPILIHCAPPEIAQETGAGTPCEVAAMLAAAGTTTPIVCIK